MTGEVYAVVPDGIDDPARPSGGNHYDRAVLDGLAALGWTVHEHALLDDVPDGETVLIDGLIALNAPEAVSPHVGRLRAVVLAHMPLGDGALLRACAAVIATSAWAAEQLTDRYGVERLHVAQPGVEPAELAPGSDDGGSLLCVAAVHPGKGHDVLLAALAEVADLPWRCVCVGSLERDPGWVAGLRLDPRVEYTGARVNGELDASYAAADLLVHPSREESYGMVVAEALARGIPVIASDVGGVSEALGQAGAGTLVPPDDPTALAGALRAWLTDPELRARLRVAARERRATLTGWDRTTAAVAEVLAG